MRSESGVVVAGTPDGKTAVSSATNERLAMQCSRALQKWSGGRGKVQKLEDVGGVQLLASARSDASPRREIGLAGHVRKSTVWSGPSRNREWMPSGSSGNDYHAAPRGALRPWKPTSSWKRSGSCSPRRGVRPHDGAQAYSPNWVALPAERRRGSQRLNPLTRGRLLPNHRGRSCRGQKPRHPGVKNDEARTSTHPAKSQGH